MYYSLNCLVLGETPTKIFSIFYGEHFPIRDFHVKFGELTVAGFKEALSEKSGITEMNVWKVELGFHEINNFSTEDTIKNHDKSEKIDDNPMLNFSTYYSNADDNKKPKAGYLHIFIVPAGQKRPADPESAETEPKRKKDNPTFVKLIVDLREKIPLDRPPKLYPIPNIAGRFHKIDIPISGRNYVDMRLDVETTTTTGRKLIDNLKNETKACYLLYAVSGAGKTRAIFDMSMNENGIYVVYVECRPSADISNRDFEPTMDRNFAQLVASIESAFGSCNDTINNSSRAEAKRLIILEFTARILYLILLKNEFPDITPRDYLLSQLNGGQECITSIRNELRDSTHDDLQSIISSALRYLKDKLPGQESLIFAIDESNVASNKLFSGYFLNTNNQHPRGLLTPMIEILRLFEISTVIAGTAFTLKQGNDIQSDIGKGNKAKYIIKFDTIDNSKDAETYIMRYLDLSDCEIDKIEDFQYLVGRPRLMARLVMEIINTEKESQENKQIVLEYAVNKTVQSIKNDMIGHLEVIVNEAYEKTDLRNVALREILMTLFVNCWFFNGYVSKSEIDDYSAELVNCGIASLKSDKDVKFWQVKEPLAKEVVKIVLFPRYNKPTDAMVEKLIHEFRRSVYSKDSSDTSKGIVWQYLVIGRLLDFKSKTVYDFVNEIYDDQPHLPDWTKEATIDIESYGNSQMFSRLDAELKDDVDVIEKLLNYSRFSKYLLVPEHLAHPDGIYIGKLDVSTIWTLLLSAKMLTENLSGEEFDADKRSTDWNLLYYKKNGRGIIKNCEDLRQKLDYVRNEFTCQGSLRIHFILPGVAQKRTSNTSNSDRGGCYTENNDVIMYIDKNLLERYFSEYAPSLRKFLGYN